MNRHVIRSSPGLASVAWLMLAAGCEVESIDPANLNRAPEIRSLVVSPDDTLVVGSSVTISATVVDLENDSLEYAWFRSRGEFLDSITSQTKRVRWTSDEEGTAVIEIRVKDLFHEVSASVEVTMMPQGALPNPPVITALRLSRDRLLRGDTLQAFCEAVDFDTPAVQLSIAWRSSAGTYLENNRFGVRWVAPSRIGEVWLVATVSDERYSVSDSAKASVMADTLVYLANDFGSRESVEGWTFGGMLAGLGAMPGGHSLAWDSLGGKLRITGRSDYSTFAYKFDDGRFEEGAYSILVQPTDLQFGRAAFLPEYRDSANYVMVGVNYFQQSYHVLSCRDGAIAYLAEGWRPFSAGVDLRLEWRRAGQTASAGIGGENVWSGTPPEWSGATTVGVAVYGLRDSGALLFDNLRVGSE
ncbi:MAG: hypothetical protein FJY67_04495 [Calditrichaeota bacterium]|nr:hypothetical protein [Calditrichota bacterium]